MTRIGSFVALALLIAAPVRGFEVQENWVGNEVRWEDEDLPVEFIIDSVNIVPGDGRRPMVSQAMDAWNRTGGIRLLFTLSNEADSDNRMTDGDGKSEILFTTSAEIDGNAGRERTTHNCAGCRRIVETDVAVIEVSTALTPPPATNSFRGCTSQSILIHEFGHSIGLDHETDRLAMMQPICTDSPRVSGVTGGYTVLPDDQQGARQQYAGNGDEVNVFAVAQFMRRELPELYRDRYQRREDLGLLRSDPNTRRLINFGNTGVERVFNPDDFSCILYADFDPACSDATYDLVNNNPNRLNLCPGGSLDVPFTVANRTNSSGAERVHAMGFYLTNGTNVPFDPQSQFLIDLDGPAGAILDNEMDFDSTGSLNSTGVQTLTLSDDPDCAPEGGYRLWHGVDICHQLLEGNGTVAAGGILENDNFALTGIRLNILAPGAPACAPLGLPASDGVCPLADLRKVCDAPPLDPPDGEPQPPDDCIAGDEACICAAVPGSLGDLDGHPDGNHSVGQFCPDDGDIERTCVSQGSFGLCETCGAFGDLHVGCACESDDACGADLTCWGEETQGGTGDGTCHPMDDGPPPWTCIADCQALLGPQAFCYNDHPSGTAMCLDANCGALESTQCWENDGQLVGVDDQPTVGPVCRSAPDDSPLSGSCQIECGPGTDPEDPGLDVTCASLGYPDIYQCDLQVAGGACRPFPF